MYLNSMYAVLEFWIGDLRFHMSRGWVKNVITLAGFSDVPSLTFKVDPAISVDVNFSNHILD